MDIYFQMRWPVSPWLTIIISMNEFVSDWCTWISPEKGPHLRNGTKRGVLFWRQSIVIMIVTYDEVNWGYIWSCSDEGRYENAKWAQRSLRIMSIRGPDEGVKLCEASTKTSWFYFVYTETGIINFAYHLCCSRLLFICKP